MFISVIIPTYNEEDNIIGLISFIEKNSFGLVSEIIVVDGGSTDKTKELIKPTTASIYTSKIKGRAAQMNYGAEKAKGEVLYFLHADTVPPKSFAKDILHTIKEGYSVGCFRFKFKSERFLLKINAYFTRFDKLMCRGGDQSLFVKKNVFEAVGKYKNEYVIMEEYEFIKRVRKEYLFKIIPKDVIVSARKYENNNYFRVNFANLIVFVMFFLRMNPQKLAKTYKVLLSHPKN